MIFQVSNKIKVMNQSSLKSPSNLLWAYTFFQSFKHAQFILKVFLEDKFEKSGFTPMIIKKKLRVLTFEIWNPTLITENMYLIWIDKQNVFHSTVHYR